MDEEDIRGFVSRDYPGILAALTALCGSRAAAEDALQDALARAWEQADRGRRIETLRFWVIRVATNNLRSAFRRAGAERRRDERAARRSAVGDQGESEKAIERMDLVRELRALPRRQREVLVLHYLLDLGIADVALAMRVREGTVKALLHQGRSALAQAVDSTEEADEHGWP